MVTYPHPFPPPTLAGFQAFVTDIMAVPTAALSLTAPAVGFSFNVSMLTVNTDLNFVGLYAPAVYNLAGSLLLNFAPDGTGTDPKSTYFEEARSSEGYDLIGFSSGVVAASGDQGTSVSLVVPEAYQGLTTDDLQRLKDPYGRQYVAWAQMAGPTIVGLS